MILHHLSQPRIMRSQPGNRTYTAPLAAYRRPAVTRPVLDRKA